MEQRERYSRERRAAEARGRRAAEEVRSHHASLFTLALAVAASVALAACDTTPTGPGPAPSDGARTNPSGSGGPSPAAAPGVEACERYVASMQACIAKLPEAERGPRSEALEATKRAWSDTTGGAEARAQLETTCRAALAALEAAPCP